MKEFRSAELDLIEKDGSLYAEIPKDWSGLEERKPWVLVNDIIIIVPQHVLNSTGELLMYKLMEGLMELGVIKVDDIQKAAEHFV